MDTYKHLSVFMFVVVSTTVVYTLYGDVDMDLLAYDLPLTLTSMHNPPTVNPLPSGVAEDAVNW